MAKLTLNWPVGRYRREIVPASTRRGEAKASVSRSRVRSAATIAESIEYERFVRDGPAIDKPVHDCAAIYENLVRLEPDEFVNTFGLLIRGKTEALDHFMSWRREVGQLLAAKALGEEGWAIAKKWFDTHPKAVQLTGGHGEDGAGRLQLQFRPRDLLSFIVAQLIQDWRTGVEYRWCTSPGCHNWFYYGSETGKRKTALYCSTKCKAAHFYKKGKAK